MKYLTMLIKPASSTCNLRCRYCFYGDVANNRECANFGVMSKDTMSTLIDKALSYFNEEATITFAFQGGEPTCAGLEYFEAFVAYTLSKKRSNCTINYSIQTNATLLNDEWMVFLKKNQFLVGVSLDGFVKNHNAVRQTQNNEGTYELVLRNIELLRKMAIDFNILSVLTSSLAKHPKELYQFYKKHDFKYVQLIPCLPKLNNRYDEYSLKPQEFYAFYKVFFDLWYKDYQKKEIMNVTLFDNVIPLFANVAPYLCGYLGKCQLQFVVEANGGVYPCDFYVLDEYLLGNILDASIDELAKTKVAKEFINEQKCPCSLCLKCEFKKMCNGQCKRLNVNYYSQDYCGYQKLLRYIKKDVLQIIQQNNLVK